MVGLFFLSFEGFSRAELVVLSIFISTKHETQLKSTHFKKQDLSMEIASLKQERETKLLVKRVALFFNKQ